MTEITDEFMRRMISGTKSYSIVILKAGPKRDKTGVEEVIWEHGRRNDVRLLMEEDPGVKEGVFVYEIHACRSFPGDRTP